MTIPQEKMLEIIDQIYALDAGKSEEEIRKKRAEIFKKIELEHQMLEEERTKQ